jgi:hypothetical protein
MVEYIKLYWRTGGLRVLNIRTTRFHFDLSSVGRKRSSTVFVTKFDYDHMTARTNNVA